MNFDFNEDQRLLQQTVRDFLTAECPVDRIRGLWDTTTGRSPELWKQLAEIGIPGLLVPEVHDGLGMDETDMVLLLEETGRSTLWPGYFASSFLKSVSTPSLPERKFSSSASTVFSFSYSPTAL